MPCGYIASKASDKKCEQGSHQPKMPNGKLRNFAQIASLAAQKYRY